MYIYNYQRAPTVYAMDDKPPETSFFPENDYSTRTVHE